MRVTQSQNVPLSCLSQPLADWLAEAAYRDILGLSYARAFSAAWSTAWLWPEQACICFFRARPTTKANHTTSLIHIQIIAMCEDE